MSLFSYNDKSILILCTTISLITLFITVYLVINNKERISTGNVNEKYIIDTTGLSRGIPMRRHNVSIYEPPINSSNVVPEDWNRIAADIGKIYEANHSLVVICEKDTLPYTASALSFMLENLTKPVIVTTLDNLPATLSNSTTIPELMVMSEKGILRGCRTIVNSVNRLVSPQYPILSNKNSLSPIQSSFNIKFINPNLRIVVVKIFPGVDGKYLKSFQNSKIHGMILEVWNMGKSPSTEDFLKSINDLIKQGTIIIGISQYDNEESNHQLDPRLLEAGVLPGYDSTTPAAYAKLSFLLSNVKDRKLIGKLMDKSFRGEITVNSA